MAEVTAPPAPPLRTVDALFVGLLVVSFAVAIVAHCTIAWPLVVARVRGRTGDTKRLATPLVVASVFVPPVAIWAARRTGMRIRANVALVALVVYAGAVVLAYAPGFAGR
ncbi:MAG: hypothetical protein U0169_05520 [Polyangiaceae bacterium]